jgi:hypothetical protein
VNNNAVLHSNKISHFWETKGVMHTLLMRGVREQTIVIVVITILMLRGVTHCGVVDGELFIGGVVTLVWVLWVVVLGWAVVTGWGLELERVASRVCGGDGGAWAVLVGSREALV